MAKTGGMRVVRGKTGKGAAWKQSKAVAAALVAAIVLIWVGMLWWWLGGGQTYNIEGFPHTFMAEDGSGEPLIIKADTNNPPRSPFQKDGKWYWEAFVCNNPDCPGKKADKPFIFPAVNPWIKDLIKAGKYDPSKPMGLFPGEMGATGMPMPPPMYGMTECPKCKAAKKKPFHVSRYYTPEGQKMLDEMIKKVQAASGGK